MFWLLVAQRLLGTFAEHSYPTAVIQQAATYTCPHRVAARLLCQELHERNPTIKSIQLLHSAAPGSAFSPEGILVTTF